MKAESLNHFSAVGDARAAAPFDGVRSQESQRSVVQGKRVVIVEDEGLTQMLLRRIVAQAGMEVVGSAVNGAQGVELVLRERPDIVLMDINMPVMDGLEASRRILEQVPVCVVLLTAFDDPEHVNDAKEVGASGYVLKPIDRSLLLPQLEAAVRRHERERRPQ